MSEFLLSPSVFPLLAAMLGLMVASGFFSGSETALFYLSHDQLREMRSGSSRERMAAALLGDPDRLLTGVLFCNLVINLTYFALSVAVAQVLTRRGDNAAAGLFGLLSLFAIILCGEVLPKSMAVVLSRPLAGLVSWPLAFLVRVLDPVILALRRVSRVANRTFWPHVARERHLSPEDLERAVEASEMSEDVIRQERQVLHDLLDLSEITAEEVMRPRGTYVTLPPPVHLSHLKRDVPAGDVVCVAHRGTDEIEGAIVLSTLNTLPEHHLEARAEEVVHVPWCANLAETLQLLRERFSHVAVVINEHGETIGIVLYDDLIDSIFAPQASRGRRLLRHEPVLEVGRDRYQVEGITTLRYLCRRLGLEYEPDPDGLVTVAGLFYDVLEHLPAVDDQIKWRGYRLRVIEVTRRGRLRVFVEKIEAPVAEGEPNRSEGGDVTHD